ncbi:MAG: TonB-dependent receptor [Sphingomonadaceae bacterium]|nr:TonB-dependent receptor [Sphingomonadaceae bacterium]
MKLSSRCGARRAILLGAASVAALPGASGRAQTVVATPTPTGQDVAAAGGQADADGAEMVVYGIRAANETAIRLKRNADTVVDAITAEDIGALPDKSITETLQRIPGVSINRFAAVNDPDHVSEEGQSPVIRGLPYVESQFNGRDAFTANRGRALNFQDIPPDLAATVEVYKNQTADQIEGGIAGNINIVTRRPLDTTHDYAVFNADANWGDQRHVVTPEGSGIISKQWNTSIGRIGVLASGSYSEIDERVDNARITTYRDRRAADPSRGILASSDGPVTGGLPGVDYYVPLGGGYSRQDNDRFRIGASAALQWESLDGNLLATFQYIHAESRQVYTERTFGATEDGGDTGNTDIVGGVGAAVFDANNVFLKGVLDTNPPGRGTGTIATTRGAITRSNTNDYSGHLTWKASSRLRFDLDGQYVRSASNQLDTSIFAVGETIQSIDNTGRVPVIGFAQPTLFSRGYGGFAPYSSFGTSTSATANPATTFWRAAQDHQENTKGDEYAIRGDGQFDFADDSFLKRVKFGARYAERRQTIRSDGYNWGNLSERWNQGITTASDITPAGFGAIALPGFLHEGSPPITILGVLGNPAQNYNTLVAGAAAIRAFRPSYGWGPLASGSRNGSGADPASIANGAGDGFHNLGEISTNDEKTYAGYARLDFGTRDVFGTGFAFDGNVGLRYVRTDSSSTGFYSVPSISSVFPGLPAGATTIDCNTYVPVRQNATQHGYNICLNSAAFRTALLAFLGTSNTYTPNTTAQSYDNWLPSINLRLAPTEKLQFRFAWSKAITRPSFNDLRNYTSFGIVGPIGTLTADQPYPSPTLTANAYGNPLLRPTRSDNFDLTAEFYYSRAGSITIGGFYKQLTNVYSVLNGIAAPFNPGGPTPNIGVDPANPTVLQFTNNGVTQAAYISVTANNNHEVDIRGFEIDLRQNSFGFLWHKLDGLGISANFTYIDADKLQYQPILAQNYDTSGGYSTTNGTLASFDFPGISRYNANAEIFYDKYGVQARLAYNWRSSYFVSSQDSLAPNDPTYTASSGFLDASVFYALTKNVKVGVTASNIANERIATYNVINRAGLQALRGVNEADRRVTGGVRVNF